MAKKKKKKGGLFKKALKAGALVALAPMLPVMIGLIAATVTTNPMAAKALKKKLKKKKLKYVVQEFVDKVIKKKKNLEDLESNFDFQTLQTQAELQGYSTFEGGVRHLSPDVRSFEDMLESGLTGADVLKRDHMEDNFVQAIADIVKMCFSFIKGLKKKKDKGEKVSPAEVEAIKESESVDEEKADEAVAKAKKAEGFGGLPLKPILIGLAAVFGIGILFKLVKK